TTTTTTTTTIPSPYVKINQPTNNQTVQGYILDIQADLLRADTVVVTVDGDDVTAYLAVTPTQVYGTLAFDAGTHTLTVLAENVTGQTQASVIFKINMGEIEIIEPAPGSTYNIRDIGVVATYLNINPGTIHVLVDDGGGYDDWTGDLSIGGGFISGEFPYVDAGDYTLRIYGTHPNHVDPEVNPDGIVEAYSYFSIEIVPAHIDVSVDRNQIETGEVVNVTYAVIDENGNDVTGTTNVDWDVVPPTGAVVDEFAQTVLFTQPGQFKINISAIVGGEFVEGYAYVWVDAQAPGSVEIELSDYDVPAGQQISATATVYNEQGQETYGKVIWSAWPNYGVSITQGNPGYLTFTRAGEVAVRGTVEGSNVFDEKIVIVRAGDPWRIDLLIPDPVIPEGGYTHPAAVLRDQWGNIVTEVPAAFAVNPTFGVQLNTPAAGDITFNNQGIYDITATAAPPWNGLSDTDSVQVIDMTAPDIEIWTPDRGLWMNQGSTLFSGIVHGCDYINDVAYFSDSPATPRDLSGPPNACQFSHNHLLGTGLNVLQIEVVEGGSGNHAKASVSVMNGPKVPDGALVPNSMRLRINESGFLQLSQVVLPILQELVDQIPEMLYAMNPIFDEKVKLWGITLASARAEVRYASFGNPWFTLDVLPDLGIELDAWVDDIDLEFKVKGTILGIGYSISGDVGFDRVRMIADAFIYVDENDRFTVEIERIRMLLSGFNFDINNFPDSLEDLFEDTIEDIIEDLIEDVLSDAVPPLLEELLNQIPTSFTFDVGGISFAVEYAFDHITWDEDGGSFYMDMSMDTPDIVPGIPNHGGSLYTPGIVPPHNAMGKYMPGSANPYGIGVMLADDFLNQALNLLYRTGLISQDLDLGVDTSNALINLIFPGLDAAASGDIIVKLRPQFPPVLYVAPQGGSPTYIPVEIQMGELEVNMFVDTGADEVLFLQMAVGLILPADMGVKFPDNTIELFFGDPEMAIYVFAEPLINWDNNLFEDVAPLLADILIPLLSEFLGGIQLPTFEGYGITVLDQDIMGANNDFIGIFSDILFPTN
ncbi:hypothetical protein K8I61_15170, partial [bacterium]|nr:hypothetical protein [bacterium]